jgi:hypothetical protein
MKMPDEIDTVVRQAADRPVHVARLATGVMARLSDAPAHTAWFAPGIAAFVVLLLATPVAILQYQVDTTSDYVSAAGLGEAEILDADLGTVFAEGTLE